MARLVSNAATADTRVTRPRSASRVASVPPASTSPESFNAIENQLRQQAQTLPQQQQVDFYFDKLTATLDSSTKDVRVSSICWKILCNLDPDRTSAYEHGAHAQALQAILVAADPLTWKGSDRQSAQTITKIWRVAPRLILAPGQTPAYFSREILTSLSALAKKSKCPLATAQRLLHDAIVARVDNRKGKSGVPRSPRLTPGDVKAATAIWAQQQQSTSRQGSVAPTSAAANNGKRKRHADTPRPFAVTQPISPAPTAATSRRSSRSGSALVANDEDYADHADDDDDDEIEVGRNASYEHQPLSDRASSPGSDLEITPDDVEDSHLRPDSIPDEVTDNERFGTLDELISQRRHPKSSRLEVLAEADNRAFSQTNHLSGEVCAATTFSAQQPTQGPSSTLQRALDVMPPTTDHDRIERREEPVISSEETLEFLWSAKHLNVDTMIRACKLLAVQMSKVLVIDDLNLTKLRVPRIKESARVIYVLLLYDLGDSQKHWSLSKLDLTLSTITWYETTAALSCWTQAKRTLPALWTSLKLENPWLPAPPSRSLSTIRLPQSDHVESGSFAMAMISLDILGLSIETPVHNSAWCLSLLAALDFIPARILRMIQSDLPNVLSRIPTIVECNVIKQVWQGMYDKTSIQHRHLKSQYDGTSDLTKLELQLREDCVELRSVVELLTSVSPQVAQCLSRLHQGMGQPDQLYRDKIEELERRQVEVRETLSIEESMERIRNAFLVIDDIAAKI